MKKPTFKRLGLGLIQHLMAMGIVMMVAGILFNSFLTVESMHGTKTYTINPLSAQPEFEDSEVYRDIFRTAVSDITRLVVIKGQIETNGRFDPTKKIDVTEYASRKGKGNDCPVTAVYELEDLIKWGKYGVEYNDRVMSMTEFLNYFGPVISPYNFDIGEDGQLFFAGFSSEKESTKSIEEVEKIEEAFKSYTDEQLEDMAYSYIMVESTEEISVSREDDGTQTVFVPMLICRYSPISGDRQLANYANNWVDYMKLQYNVVDAIENLTTNYEQYQNCNEMYQEGKSNLKYMVRMTENGKVSTYTNVSDLQNEEDSDITDYFAEYRRYLIYYPDSLSFTGNTVLSENEIYEYIREYKYAYPDSTHIWIGVDSNYTTPGDAFYTAHMVFQKIVPNIGVFVSVIVLLVLVWFGLFLYLTATAGIAVDEEDNRVKYLNSFDHIWTELLIALFAAGAYGAVRGYAELTNVADSVYATHSLLTEQGIQKFYEYGLFGSYGMGLSLYLGILWYSAVRRIRSRNLWKDSFLHWVWEGCCKFISFIFRHRNSAISTLLPYNLFIFLNVGSVFTICLRREYSVEIILILAVLASFDVFVGMKLFRHNAEQIEIVEGINKIRDGEVDFKLDVDTLHGANRDMADAVNNIGEGIRKAVRTSMKDEQMKTDLITNVSHDIKTPLTSIINYVDLLKRLKITQEPAKSYIDILEGKSQRLKQLTDDLVEASKISSGNIVLNMEQLNFTELLNQSIGEFSEKFESKNLQVVFTDSNIPANIYADSRRMWRIVENLFNNICKYALEGTRVYVDLKKEEGQIEVSIKNISESQMNIRPEELTERFIRGDVARTAEGSGLGLSIAQSLTKLQGGTFRIDLDGDLFKVILSFPEYIPAEAEPDNLASETEEKLEENTILAETVETTEDENNSKA